MTRGYDDGEDDGDTDPPPPNRQHKRALTPVSGVNFLEAETERLSNELEKSNRQLRALQDWKSAMAGAQGQPGALQSFQRDLEEVKKDLAEHRGKAEQFWSTVDGRLRELEHTAFKVIATATIAASVVGGIVGVAMHYVSK